MRTRRPWLRPILSALLWMVAGTLHAATGDEQPLAALPHSPGLDVGSLDRSVDPCVDFYRHSCGGWQQKNPIPPDQAAWEVYSKLHEDNLRFLWGLLLDAAAQRPDRTAAEQKTGDYFAACMDRTAIDAAGMKPLVPLFTRIRALTGVKQAAGFMAALHAGDIDAMFRFGSEQDFANSTRVIASADAGGLGLPDRDQYVLAGAKPQALRDAYRAHIVRLFELAGESRPAATAAARTVLEIETALARASLTREQRRDPRRMYHRMTLAQLQRLAPAFDWPAYTAASGVPEDTPINVAQPAFFARLNLLLQKRPLPEWQTYLRWHVLNSRAPYLSMPFAQASFDFYSTTLRGVQTMPPRWKQCVRAVDHDLGEALGQVFVKRTFAPQTKERAAEMARAIEAAMRTRIRGLPWMSERTKQAALAKLDTLVNKIGYPDLWRDYAALEVRRDDFFGNVERGRVFESKRQIAKIGKPVDRAEWDMTPPTVNAYYDAQLNTINFPAGVLQPPLFDPQMDDAPNYGNTGSTIGHELTHGFDDEGRQFDAHGNLRDWWTKKDAAEFAKRTQCIVQQYSGYTVIDDVRINGRLTLGEDVADLGGAALAYMAWQTMTAGHSLAPRDGYTPEQRFFIGMAQWACSNERPEVQRLHALTDVHSPNRWRVNGVVSNMPEFAKAFSCKPGQPMVRERPCRVW
jgi:endothelin-converting enzyme/putative endopeptidase